MLPEGKTLPSEVDTVWLYLAYCTLQHDRTLLSWKDNLLFYYIIIDIMVRVVPENLHSSLQKVSY